MRAIIYFLVFILPISAISQDWEAKMIELKSNKELYTVFNKFYTDSIKQETEEELGYPCYNKIDMVYGLNYFDYNNDNSDDVLVEFSTYPSDGGTITTYNAVLFENLGGNYKYKSHFYPGFRFAHFKNSHFYFSGNESRFSEKIITRKYKLLNKEFKEVN